MHIFFSQTNHDLFFCLFFTGTCWRLRKALSSKELASMLEQNHDYNKLLKEFEKHGVIVTNFYLSNKKVAVNDETKIPRKRFTEERKQEIREHYLLTDNFAKTAKSFCLNESTVRKIVKATLRNDVKPPDKGNRSVAGRPLTYPKEAENELLAWVLQLLDVHMPVSVLALQEKAKKVIRPHSPSFGASRGWVEKFYARLRLSLRNRTLSAKSYHDNLKKFSVSSTRMLGVSCVLASTLVL